MRASRLLSLLLCALVLFSYPVSTMGQVATTPPMGWNSWNAFHKSITDTLIRNEAAAMVSSGMLAAGYNYVNIDDGWQGTRDANGNIQSNARFPDMAGLATYVHGLGLKIGIYSSPGPRTCGGNIGSFGHEAQDAQTFAAWGMDFLKYDWCSCYPKLCGAPKDAISKMSAALQSTGRPMVFKISTYGEFKPWLWAASVGVNMWGTSLDLKDEYFRMIATATANDGLESFSGPKVVNGNGGWNDPDMLQVGNGGMTDTEYRTHMSFWAIMAAPLIAGNDLTKMSATTLALLTNADIIAVDQDPLGEQGHRVWQQGPQEIWVKPMADGTVVVGFFNRVEGATTLALSFNTIGVKGNVSARDLWQQKDLGPIKDHTAILVAGHGATMLRLTVTP